MELLYILLVLLVVTRTLGELAERLGQPVLVGELVAGIGLGLLASSAPDTFPILAEVENNEVFHGITELAMFFLMLLAGLELRPKDLVKASKSAVFVALGGMFLPLGLGLAIGWVVLPRSDVFMAQTLFLGTCLAITAVPVSVKILIDLGKMQTKLGQAVVAAALIDDILSLLLLGILTSVLESGSFPGAMGMLLLLGKLAAFFAIILVMARYILPWLGARMRRLHVDEFEFSALIIVALSFSVLAEVLGMHFILGAFAAGLFFSRRTIDAKAYKDVVKRVTATSTGFLAPLFFASIGFHLDLSALSQTPLFVLSLVGLASLGKVVGAGLPAKLSGFSTRDASAIGVAMNARGAVELIIAGVALRAGLFDRPEPPPEIVSNLFSSVVIMAVVTTLLAPVLLKWILAPKGSESGDEDES